jgi:alcohol dehydrogenase class IV
MQTFTFNSVTRIVFGRGTFSQIGATVAEFGSAVLVVSNADNSGKLGLNDKLNALLKEKSVVATHFPISGEPTLTDIDRGLDAARSGKCSVVLGLGGGSAIDAAKAIAALLANGGSALDYMEVIGKGQKITKPSVPFISVPTTAGTGAEVTRNAVIGAPEKQFKASLRSEYLLARVALIDPELQLNVRPEITARTGMDALTQLIEAYTSPNANPMTDALALQGIDYAGRSLLKAYRNGSDIEAREGMALAALLSGVTLTNAGLGAVHGFAAPMGARYPAPHGTICAALLPHVTRANIAALRDSNPQHPALDRYARVAETLGCGRDPDKLVAYLMNFVTELKIPRLAEFGLKSADFPEVIAAARKANSMKTNPVTLNDAAMNEILAAAL